MFGSVPSIVEACAAAFDTMKPATGGAGGGPRTAHHRRFLHTSSEVDPEPNSQTRLRQPVELGDRRPPIIEGHPEPVGPSLGPRDDPSLNGRVEPSATLLPDREISSAIPREAIAEQRRMRLVLGAQLQAKRLQA